MRRFVLLICLLLPACAPRAAPAPTPSPLPRSTASWTALITRDQAIAAALTIASASAPEISGALVAPSNIQAEQLSLGQAMTRMFGNANAPRGYTADMLVWVVTMDGLWASQAQAPGVTATQLPYHHYIIVLDASSGMQIESSLTP